MSSRIYQQRMGWTLAVMALLTPVLYWTGQHAVSNMQTSPTTWVPEAFPKRVDYQWFEATFETNDALILSWDGCKLDDERLDDLYQTLTNPEEGTEEGDKINEWLLRAYTGPSMIEEMRADPLDLKGTTPVDRLKGSLVGPDGETTCCVILLTEDGVVDRREGIPFFASLAERVTQVPEEDLYMVGPPVDATTIDNESIKSMRWFLAPSMLLTIILCRLCLRSWAYTGMVIFVALFGEMLTLSLVWFSGEPMNAVLIVMPPLVMVLTVSAAVHLVNYYHDEVRVHGLADAARKAMANGRTPCILATCTTAIGLLSLLLSDIVPVSRFGLYSTCGIVTTLVLLFLILPGAMERWPVKAAPRRESALDRFKDLSGLANFVTRYPTMIVIFCLLMMGTLGYGLRWIQTSVNVTAMFSPGSRILRDYEWFEANLGPTVPLEVTLNFAKKEGAIEADEAKLNRAGEPGDSKRRRLENMQKLRRLEVVSNIQQRVENIEGLSGTNSAATFFREIENSHTGRIGQARKMDEALEKFDEINYYVNGEDIESWRISGRVEALGRIDYGRFLAEIQNQIDPRLKAFDTFWRIEDQIEARNQSEEAAAEEAGNEDYEPGPARVLLTGVSDAEKKAILDLLAKDAAGEARRSLSPEEIEPTNIYAEQLIELLLARKEISADDLIARPDGRVDAEKDNLLAVVQVRDAAGYRVDQAEDSGALLIDGRVESADPNVADDRGDQLLAATYTGVMPLAYEVQRALLNDLIVSFGTAVALVSIVMIFVVRSPFAGLVSMLPNVFPMVMLFGMTSWRGVPIDIGSVMTASVALGIAVDDTLHFLTWFSRENRRSGDKKAAVRLAFGHCAKAMAQTTLICGIGLAVYSLSWFVPTRQFAWMMITLLLAALVGDLLMLPAMLASPVGRLFGGGNKGAKPDPEPSPGDIPPLTEPISGESEATTDSQPVEEPVGAHSDGVG